MDLPHDREPPESTHRQMTLGECIAIVRLTSALGVAPAKYVDVDELIELLDSVHVCTTCGWSVKAHAGTQKSLTCGQAVHTLLTDFQPLAGWQELRHSEENGPAAA